MPQAAMRIAPDNTARVCLEREIYESLLPLDGAAIVELGCGRAEHTRKIATQGRGRQILALEVDELQHARNLQISDLPNVRFELAGAQAIPASARSFDIAMMFKSLHHVPLNLLDAAFSDIARVLKPGGYLYISEPVFAGAFNDVLRLFHNEQAVRAAAFAATERAVSRGLFTLAQQCFFATPVAFADFADFERLVIGVTHTQHRLTPALHAEVRNKFEQHMSPNGARFETPMRVDLLRKP